MRYGSVCSGVELTKGWYSTIIHDKVWSNESEAIAATVAKLKEVLSIAPNAKEGQGFAVAMPL